MVAENCIMLLVPEMGIADLFDPSVSTNESTEISTVYVQMRGRGGRQTAASTPLRVEYQAGKPGGYFFFLSLNLKKQSEHITKEINQELGQLSAKIMLLQLSLLKGKSEVPRVGRLEVGFSGTVLGFIIDSQLI